MLPSSAFTGSSSTFSDGLELGQHSCFPTLLVRNTFLELDCDRPIRRASRRSRSLGDESTKHETTGWEAQPSPSTTEGSDAEAPLTARTQSTDSQSCLTEAWSEAREELNLHLEQGTTHEHLAQNMSPDRFLLILRQFQCVPGSNHSLCELVSSVKCATASASIAQKVEMVHLLLQDGHRFEPMVSTSLLNEIMDSLTGEDGSTLHGLAQLHIAECQNPRLQQHVRSAVRCELQNLSNCMHTMSARTAVDCLWTVAKLEMGTGEWRVLVSACMQRCSEHPLDGISPQRLCQCLWSLAKLGAPARKKEALCLRLTEEILVRDGSLQSLTPCEMSMSLWATAQLFSGRPAQQVMSFVAAVAAAATERLSEFGVQSLSNVAWAVGKLQVAKRGSAGRRFLEAVALQCAEGLAGWSPQAVANVCFALSRAEGCSRPLQNFAICAVHVAMRLVPRFEWQDLASIATALQRMDLRAVEVRTFLSWLLISAGQKLQLVPTRPLLNIAIAAEELLGVNPLLQELVRLMASELDVRKLNTLDQRQWQALRRLAPERVQVSLADCLC